MFREGPSYFGLKKKSLPMIIRNAALIILIILLLFLHKKQIASLPYDATFRGAIKTVVRGKEAEEEDDVED